MPSLEQAILQALDENNGNPHLAEARRALGQLDIPTWRKTCARIAALATDGAVAEEPEDEPMPPLRDKSEDNDEDEDQPENENPDEDRDPSESRFE